MLRRLYEHRQALMSMLERELEESPGVDRLVRLASLQRQLRNGASAAVVAAQYRTFVSRFADWDDDRLRNLLASMHDLRRQATAYLAFPMTNDEACLVRHDRRVFVGEMYARVATLGARSSST